jgi:hypothetical protein
MDVIPDRRPLFARMLDVDRTALRLAPDGYRAFIAVARPSERSYTGAERLRNLMMLAPLTVVPDIGLAHLFLHGRWAWAAWAHDLLSLYVVIFLAGAYAAAAYREHELDGAPLVFHAGLFGRASVSRTAIRAATPLPGREARAVARSIGATRLVGDALGAVLLELAEDAVVLDMLGRTKTTKRLLVPSDAPERLALRLMSY